MAGWNEGTGGQMIAQERALVAAVCMNPYDDTPRMVYADWLEEQDPPRLRCGACMYWRAEACPTCGAAKDAPDEERTLLDTSRKQRAELIRLQHALPGIPSTATTVVEMPQSEWDAIEDKSPYMGFEVARNETDRLQGVVRAMRVDANTEHTAAVARIREIVAHARDREWFLPPGLHTCSVTAETTVRPRPYNAIDAVTNKYNTYSQSWHGRVRLEIDRGFVGAVYCPMEMWSGQIAPSMMYAPENGDLPDTAQPVTAVYFTDQTEAEVRDMDVGLRSMWPTVRFGWLDTYGRTNPAGTVGLVERPVAAAKKPGRRK